jgi:hypothetical protein
MLAPHNTRPDSNGLPPLFIAHLTTVTPNLDCREHASPGGRHPASR